MTRKITVGYGYISLSKIKTPISKSLKKEQKNGSGTGGNRKPSLSVGAVGGGLLSDKSRNSLIKTLNSLEQVPDWWITLTYAGQVPKNATLWNRDLDSLRRSMSRSFPEHWFIWRLEPHKSSGRPHFHLLGSAGPNVEQAELDAWFRKHWSKITNVNLKEAPLNVEIKKVEEGSLCKLVRYMSKEGFCGDLQSLENLWGQVGRHHGVFGRSRAPLRPEKSYVLSEAEYEQLRKKIVSFVEGQISELERLLSGMSSSAPRRRRFTLEESLKNKKRHLQQIKVSDDFFTVLAPEEVADIAIELQSTAL